MFAVITPLTPSLNIKLANDPLTGASVSHIVPCCHPDDVCVVVHANTIMEKLVYMSFCNEEYVYVAKSPNKFECDRKIMINCCVSYGFNMSARKQISM